MHQRSNRSHRRWITALAMISLGWWMRAAMPASAQTINFVASTDASVVANTGLSEVVGDLFLVAGSACGNSDDKACLSSEATIQVRLPNVIIDNSTATGLRVCESFGTPCNEPGTLLTGSITVTADTILIRIREGIDLAASDRITIAGIRARIASSVLRTPGTEATAVVTATPASAATISTDPLILARSARPLLLQVTSVPEIPCSVQDAIPTLLVTEGYRTAFVDYGDAAGRSYPGQPLLPRNPLGGNANTRVRLAVSGVVAAVKIQWPLTIPAQNSTAALDLLSQSADGTTATYIYETPNQLQGDQLSEIFAVRLYPVNFNFSGSEALTGIVTAQGQLLPPPSPEDIRPRFDHPLEPDPGLPYFLLKRCTVPQTATGTAQVRAMVGNFPWSGTLNYRLEGPALFSGTQASESITGVPIGTYAAIHLSGGPAGATFSNITPSNAQALSPGGTIDYTFNFTGPTIANLQLMSNPLPVCVSSSTPVGSFHLSNATGDVQIIPAGTALAFTFSNIIDTLPTATGLGSAVVSSSAVTVQYQLPGGLRLPPGGVVTFSGTRLNLNGVANGQNITVLLTSIPPAALQLATNQAVVATASAAACLPVVNLSVTPASIQLGQSATLQWTSQNTTELDLQPGVGSVPLQGSLTVSPTSTTNYTMTARGPQGTAQASVQLTVTTAPKFISAGVTNGASFVSGLTAGAIGTIFGTRLSNVSGIVQADIIPLPPQLSGTSVTVNGIVAPPFAVANVNGQEQINFQVPWEVAGQTTATLVVSNNGELSDPVVVSPVSALPGIFTVDGTTGAILHGIGYALVTPDSPAVPGETVLIYATGLGPVTFPPATGAAALVDPVSVTPVFPQVTVGGVQAPVVFSGLAAGYVGLYQLNVQIPANIPSGNQDVIIRVGNQTSKVAKIAIR